MENTFTLGFTNKIGKNIILSDEGEYFGGDYISGRFYSGRFGGTTCKKDGIYCRIDGNEIKIDVSTKITFSE